VKDHNDQCPRGCHPGMTEQPSKGTAAAQQIAASKRYIQEMYGSPSEVHIIPQYVPDQRLTESADQELTEALNAVGSETDNVRPVSPRESALLEAIGLVTGDRNAAYGPPTQDFDRTAAALTAMGYRRLDPADGFDLPIKPHDVAVMVMQVKISRLMSTPDKRDSWVDIAGYAGCGYECTTEEGK